MTPETIERVRAGFATLGPVAPTLAEVFYDNLFRRAPALRALFPDDMAVQRDKLMRALTLAVSSLDNTEALVPVLRGLGARHVDYGVSDGDYFTVGAALLDTLADALGEDWTDEMATAWTEVYALVARTMKDGAAERLSQAA